MGLLPMQQISFGPQPSEVKHEVGAFWRDSTLPTP